MRIAQFSDLHLRHHLPGTSSIEHRHSRKMHTILAQAVALIDELAPDLLLVTGDLLDYPFDAWDDPLLLAAGARDMALIQEIVAEASCPTLLLPGNHDHPALFAPVLREQPTDQEIAGYQVVTFPEDAEDETHVPHRTGASWARLAQATAEQHTGAILVQHYVVWPERNEGYPHTYAEADAMLSIMEQRPGLTLSLSGHYHQGVPLQRHRGVWFATVPALCEAPHPVWLYELSRDTVTCQAFPLAKR